MNTTYKPFQYLSLDQQTDFKVKLGQAFRKLRKFGYFCRQNFQCCQTCGWAAVPKDKAGKVVFYHNQDNDNIPTGKIYLAWAGDGDFIVEKLREFGLLANWAGDQGKRIVVDYIAH